MRFATWLAGGVLVLALTTVAALAAPAASTSPDGTSEWCGFHDKAGAEVTCGYSSAEDCKKALGNDQDAVCMPDPAFASNTIPPPRGRDKRG
jgi:hypothetical protein